MVETVKSTAVVDVPVTVTAPPVVITRTRSTTQVEETVEATAPIEQPPQTIETTVDAAPAFTGAAPNNKAGFVALAGAMAGFVVMI